MQIKTIFFTILALLYLTIESQAQTTKEGYYSSPVGFDVYLAGNVGEIRSSHFHCGLDIKASQGVGSPIYAAADGYISRVGVSPTGYGHVIYISHPNGETSVYGHLNNFRDDIAKWVTQRQKAAKSFKVDLYPQKNQFKVTGGDTIAYLGNTGSSGGPHLHFEIRNKDNSPVNLNYYKILHVKDDIAPTLYTVTLFEQDTVAGVTRYTPTDKLIATLQKDGSYTFDKPHLTTARPFYLTYEVIDRKNGFNNTMGLYSLVQNVNGKTNFAFYLPWVSYTTSQYVKTFIEYSLQSSSKYHVPRAYISKNNKLSHYNSVVNRGLINPPVKSDSLTIETTFEDDNKNTTRVSFTVKHTTEDKLAKPTDEELAHIKAVRWDRNFSYTDSTILVTLTSGTLFDDAPLKIYSDTQNNTFTIGESTTPIAKSILVSVKATTTDKQLLHRALLQNTKTKAVSQVTHQNGWLSGKISSLGKYTVVYDTIPPKVTYQGFKGNKLTFKVSDNLSGINKYDLRIDGQWVICHWDPKSTTMFHTVETTDNLEHEFTLTVEDYTGGVTQQSGKFKATK
ncbi:MAG: M23 family metallopeptidase [Rikenellaceae bacterium]